MATMGLGYNQLATVLNSIAQQATGNKALTATDTSSFMSVAQTTLATGYDNVLNAISQTLSRTIFSIRPYTRKFKGLYVDSQRWGNHVRKINYIDTDWTNDDRKPLTDGASVDMYTIKKTPVLQTNFYGQNVYQRHTTIYRDQLDVAFTGPEEFGRFISGVMQNASDQIEQAHEVMARFTINNLIAGKISADAGNVIHLLTEYNTLTGLELTGESVYQPENFSAFVRWANSRISDITQLMTERSENFHQNVTGKIINRHTPLDRQKVYLHAHLLNQINSMVMPDVYQPNYLKFADTEAVNFWQSIESPDAINITPTIMNADGTIEAASAAVNKTGIVGIIFDEEAAGITSVNQWSAPTPFNARGGYSNIFWHFTDRYWNDFTENAVVLMMD